MIYIIYQISLKIAASYIKPKSIFLQQNKHSLLFSYSLKVVDLKFDYHLAKQEALSFFNDWFYLPLYKELTL